MQNMSDTHDHGPPNSTIKTALRQHTPINRLARWSTSLGDNQINLFAGAVSGTASGIATCPLDVIKTKLQAQGSFSNTGPQNTQLKGGTLYRGLAGTARTIVQQDGLKGLYRGLGTIVMGYIPTWAVYMTMYEGSRKWIYAHGYNDSEKDRAIGRVYAAVLAGSCSTLTTNPIWVIKTRLMSQVSRSAAAGSRTPWHYNNTWDAFRKMYRAEGIGAFYSGLGPALLGLTHVAIQFPLYEFFKQKFTGLEMGATPDEHKAGANTAGVLAATFLSKICATTATYPHEVLRTRLQTQSRVSPEGPYDGNAVAHHSRSQATNNQANKKLMGNTDGTPYKPRYRGIINTCQVILREEGWRAFYNGMGTNMLRAVPAAMTTMVTFESIKAAMGRLQEEGRQLEENDA